MIIGAELINRIGNFNSIKVQLESEKIICTQVASRNFNSIKVQLELLYSIQEMEVTRFQFHKGSIRIKDNAH